MRTNLLGSAAIVWVATLCACGTAAPEVEEAFQELKACVGTNTQLITLSDTPLRSFSSNSSSTLRTVPAGATVVTLQSCPTRGFYNVDYSGSSGWVRGNALTTAPASCSPESDSTFCSRLGKTCGSLTGSDNCGTFRTVDCGTCPTTTRTCTNPTFITSDPNGGWSTGGYYVHNNMWNTSEAGPETLYACAYNNWYVDSTQAATTSVKTYPNVHLDINNLNGSPLSNYRTITSTFSGVGPRVGIYNVAYDVWFNGVGWGGGSTEFMIWTENFGQRPLGSIQATVTSSGMTWDAWYYNDGNARVITLVAKTTLLSGSLNLREMFDWAIARGWLASNSTIHQIGYGVEICSTNNTRQRFTFTDFSVTLQ
jgi:hypothetical protein